MASPTQENIRFFLPGPTYVPEDARRAMARPLIGHRSAEFRAIWSSIAARLPGVVRTQGDVMIASGSSTLVMESAIASLVRERVLHLVCGAFGERWFSISRALGRAPERLDAPLGETVDPHALRRRLRQQPTSARYEAVALVHNETSTGVMSPLADLARVVREESDALVLVDAVSSLGGAPVETDAWGIDVVLAGVQKALALPPGLTVFTMSDRAAARAATITHRGFYTDLLRYRDKHREGGAITTPAIPLVFALDVQLDRIVAEGIEARWARHERLQSRTAAWAAQRGLDFASAAAARSRTVSCLKPPPGVSAPDVVKAAGRAGFTLGSGYGDWKPTTFRIGHMGEVREEDLTALLTTLDEVLVSCAAS